MEAVKFGTATVINHKYSNTGGHTMVSVFTVLYDELGLRYIVCNEEGYNKQLFDNIHQELPPEITFDDILISGRCWDDVLRTELAYDEFELYSYCYFEFLKEYCSTFSATVPVYVYQLPDRLYGTLSDDEREWHLENDQALSTNGYKVFLSDYYDPADFEVPADDDATNADASADSMLSKVVSFRKDLANKLSAALINDSLSNYYDEPFVLAFDGQYVELPFDAETFGKVEELLNSVIENW